MGNINTPRLDGEDRKLLGYIVTYGFVDMPFVLKFYKTDRNQETVERRITQLAKHNILEVQSMFIPHDYTMIGKAGYKAITLGKIGLVMMDNYGYSVTDYRKTLKTSASYRVYHQVQVATICECVKQQFAEANGLFKVKRVLSEKESVLKDRKNQPDAIIIFERTDDRKGNIAIFIEVERSYASSDRINGKLTSYNTVIKEKSYNIQLKLPIIASRVLFISQTDLQIDTIINKILQSSFAKDIEILVTKYSDACNHPLDEVYVDPVTRETYQLLQKIDRQDKEKEKNE